MKKRFISILLIILVLFAGGCTSKETKHSFSIVFIDVGHGDAALVECDGKWMLIDSGDSNAGDRVYRVLEDRRVRHLDILAISHLDEDHIAGLPTALRNITSIDLTLSNSFESDKSFFKDVEHCLYESGAKRKVIPKEGNKYPLGSATIEIIDSSAADKNDSLVLLITYNKTRFLFTGDIEQNRQQEIAQRLLNVKNKDSYVVDLIKVPHHGSFVGIGFLDVFTDRNEEKDMLLFL